jgi:hypothetical protein
MTKLRRGLSALLAEDQPLARRLDSAIDDIYGMGKNVATAILLVAHPDKYGVWNNRSEARMKRLGVWPDFERGDSFGTRYVKLMASSLTPSPRRTARLSESLGCGRTGAILRAANGCAHSAS